MKLLVFSDSHHSLGYLYDAIEKEMPDAVIHLGDNESDAQDMANVFDSIPFCTVPGNCDYGSTDPEEKLVEYGGVRIFLTHGHRYGVKNGLDALWSAAKRGGASIALFGHTHSPLNIQKNGIQFVNPGAGGYAVLLIQNKTFSCELRRD